MKRDFWLLCLIPLLGSSLGTGGCGPEAGPMNPVRTAPLPNLAMPLTSSGLLPAYSSYAEVMSPGACAVRYDFPNEAPIDCTTALVGGDPNHWLTTCPEHAGLITELEATVNASGHPLSVRTQWPAGTGAGGLAEYSYDSSGRLTGIVYGPTPSEPNARTVTVTSYSAGGQPTQLVTSGEVFHVTDTIFIPGSESSEINVTYDANERVTARQIRHTGANAWSGNYYDEVVTYDDAAGRINFQIDIAYVTNDRPDHPINSNVGHQIYDTDNNLLSHHLERSEGPAHDVTFTYDEGGQLLTTAFADHESDLSYLAHEIYSCP